MIRILARYILPVLLSAACQAAEITMQHQPFTLTRTFNTTVLPAEGALLISVDPKTWQGFRILELAPHGSKVAKGDVLVRFDPEQLAQKLEDVHRAVESGVPTIAQAEADLKHLQETMPHQLAAWRMAAEIAKEEHAYFTQTRRKATEDAAAESLERRKQMLGNQQEELRQLTKMYAADDLREETEEIILTRQKDAVASAEFALFMENLDYKRTIEVKLQREAVTLANQERDSAIALAKAESDLPRAIQQKQLELQGLKTNHERDKKLLAELEHDQTLLVIKAPADGVFYHGPIENGRWTPAEALKTLFKFGQPPANRPFATFVPTSAKPMLVGFLDEVTARSLQVGLKGIATPTAREDGEFPVSLVNLSSAPEPDGTYRVEFSTTLQEQPKLVTGSTAQVHIVAYHQDAALTVPTKALTFSPQGWMVEVKLADGKSEHRSVSRGRVAGETTEVLRGLEAGQVIIVPDK